MLPLINTACAKIVKEKVLRILLIIFSKKKVDEILTLDNATFSSATIFTCYPPWLSFAYVPVTQLSIVVFFSPNQQSVHCDHSLRVVFDFPIGLRFVFSF